MRAFIISIMVLGCLGMVQAQTDLPTRRPLKIEGTPKEAPKQGVNLALPSPSATPSKYSINLDPNNPVKMLPDQQLLQAGHDYKIDPKVGQPEKNGDKSFFGDMYLGDFKTTSLFIGIVCRDHEYVDGDRVRIYANGEIVAENVLLTGAFKGINLDLDKGFNRLEFEALNQGSSGPNTAQVDVFNDKGERVFSNKWNLSTGSKASLIVVKEDLE